MAIGFSGFSEDTGELPSLPAWHVAAEAAGVREKARVALGVLRNVAIANRSSRGRSFYSIRTVARHFELPTTTVTRMYEQLKIEGVLGTIWGSKTIIEPAELDNDIHLRGMLLLPVPWRSFATVSTCRLFVRNMQRSLWRERFGSQVVFYDESMFDALALTDALLEARSEGVIWLMPPRGTSSCFARLKDRGVKYLVVSDEPPINGEPGYYLSWEQALIEGLLGWKRSGTSNVIIIRDTECESLGELRVLEHCLTKVGFTFHLAEEAWLSNRQSIADWPERKSGIIFVCAKSLVRFSQAGADRLRGLLGNGRVLFLHGSVDLPFQRELNHGFDAVTFDWPRISRRIVTDLVSRGCVDHIEQQTVFSGKWSSGTTGPTLGRNVSPVPDA